MKKLFLLSAALTFIFTGCIRIEKNNKKEPVQEIQQQSSTKQISANELQEIAQNDAFDPAFYGNAHPKNKQEPPECCNHPYWHSVHRTTSSDGLSWSKNTQLVKEHASVPSGIQRADGTYILYYVDGEFDTTDCATSNDGITFEGGKCTIYGFSEKRAWDPAVIKIDDGMYRMFFYTPNESVNNREHKILSAVSKDGLNWVQEEGVRFVDEGVLDPTVLKIGDEWRMYTGHISRDNNPSQQPKIIGATSVDGLTFTKDIELELGGGVPELHQLSEKIYGLYHCGKGIEVAESTDGKTWINDRSVFEGKSKNILCDPGIVKTENEWIMYYKESKASVQPNTPQQQTNPLPPL